MLTDHILVLVTHKTYLPHAYHEKNLGEINIFDLFLPGKLPSHIHVCIYPNYLVRSTRIDDLIYGIH